jgi:hypothetical protein
MRNGYARRANSDAVLESAKSLYRRAGMALVAIHVCMRGLVAESAKKGSPIELTSRARIWRIGEISAELQCCESVRQGTAREQRHVPMRCAEAGKRRVRE